jgi:hypothetical protein
VSKRVVHECDRCGTDVGKYGKLYEATLALPGYRGIPERWEICESCKRKTVKFLNEKLFRHAFEEFELPCPHHVPCAYPCQGKAYRRAW